MSSFFTLLLYTTQITVQKYHLPHLGYKKIQKTFQSDYVLKRVIINNSFKIFSDMLYKLGPILGPWGYSYFRGPTCRLLPNRWHCQPDIFSFFFWLQQSKRVVYIIEMTFEILDPRMGNMGVFRETFCQY